MRSKNSKPLTVAEHRHLEAVKSVACAVCDAPPPTEAHHIQQGDAYTCISLCADCHRNSVLGIHGQRRAWLIRKVNEFDALNTTIRRVMDFFNVARR